MKKDKIVENECAKTLVQESHLGNEGARTTDRWGHSGNERAKNYHGKHNFFRNLIIVDIDVLFELYSAIICSLCIHSLQIVHEKA